MQLQFLSNALEDAEVVTKRQTFVRLNSCPSLSKSLSISHQDGSTASGAMLENSPIISVFQGLRKTVRLSAVPISIGDDSQTFFVPIESSAVIEQSLSTDEMAREMKIRRFIKKLRTKFTSSLQSPSRTNLTGFQQPVDQGHYLYNHFDLDCDQRENWMGECAETRMPEDYSDTSITKVSLSSLKKDQRVRRRPVKIRKASQKRKTKVKCACKERFDNLAMCSCSSGILKAASPEEENQRIELLAYLQKIKRLKFGFLE